MNTHISFQEAHVNVICVDPALWEPSRLRTDTAIETGDKSSSTLNAASKSFHRAKASKLTVNAPRSSAAIMSFGRSQLRRQVQACMQS